MLMKVLKARHGLELLDSLFLIQDKFKVGDYALTVDSNVFSEYTDCVVKDFFFKKSLHINGKEIPTYLSFEPSGYISAERYGKNLHFKGLEIPSDIKEKTKNLATKIWKKIEDYLPQIFEKAQQKDDVLSGDVRVYRFKKGFGGHITRYGKDKEDFDPLFNYYIQKDLSLAYFFYVTAHFVPNYQINKIPFHGHLGIQHLLESNFSPSAGGDIAQGNRTIIGTQPPLKQILRFGPNLEPIDILKLYKSSVISSVFKSEWNTSIVFWKRKSNDKYPLPLVIAAVNGRPVLEDYQKLKRWGNKLIYKYKKIEKQEKNLFGESAITPFSISETDLIDAKLFLENVMKEIGHPRLDSIPFDYIERFIEMTYSADKSKIMKLLDMLEDYLYIRENPLGSIQNEFKMPKNVIVNRYLRPVSDKELKFYKKQLDILKRMQ